MALVDVMPSEGNVPSETHGPCDDPVDLGIAAAPRHPGAKIALLCGPEVAAYPRDDTPGIPDPGRWELSGGVREPGETAFGIIVDPAGVVHHVEDVAEKPQRRVIFVNARIAPEAVASTPCGDDGQGRRMMTAEDDVARGGAVPDLDACLAAYLGRDT